MQEGVTPGKRAVHLSIDENLVARAEAMKLDRSAVLETALVDQIEQDRWKAWQEENRGAIDSVNDYVALNGLPLEKYRPW